MLSDSLRAGSLLGFRVRAAEPLKGERERGRESAGSANPKESLLSDPKPPREGWGGGGRADRKKERKKKKKKA